MKLLISLVLAAVATATTYGQVPTHSEEHPNEVLELIEDLPILGALLAHSEGRSSESLLNSVPLVGDLLAHSETRPNEVLDALPIVGTLRR